MNGTKSRSRAAGSVCLALVTVGFCGPSPCFGQEAPAFAFSLAPAPLVIRGPAGGGFEREIEVVLTTSGDPAAEKGATGWQFSVAAEGVVVTSVTTAGTAAACLDDDPPGYRVCANPYDSYERTELARNDACACEGLSGAVSSVVLSLREEAQLPPQGSEVVARITVAGRIPHTVSTASPPRIYFPAPGCCGATTEVSPAVTWDGRIVAPSTTSCDVAFEATPSQFIRGDANDDGHVDISDPVLVLACKFLGGLCPQCRDAADSNDDGVLDVSDAVFTLGFLFLGRPPPPAPGPEACGPDPTPDHLPDCTYDSCSEPGFPPPAHFRYLGTNEQGYLEYAHGPTGILMVLLPGGTFLMGSPDDECGHEADEAPVHEVALSPFLISKYEVTQAQWERVMGTNPSVFPSGRGSSEGADAGDFPVDSVSFDDAILFTRRTGLSLPTEAQWEFACRGGTRTTFAFGSEVSTDQVNFAPLGDDPCQGSGAARLETVPVDSFAPNAYGLFQMHGNVAEWCADRYDPEFYARPEARGPDPICLSGSGTPGLVVRGGSWGNPSHLSRSASRVQATVAPGSTVGLRVVWRRE